MEMNKNEGSQGTFLSQGGKERAGKTDGTGHRRAGRERERAKKRENSRGNGKRARWREAEIIT